MDVDVHQHTTLNTKTPGRKGTKPRNALQENVLHNGAKTVLTKKQVHQTPFRPGTAHGKKPLVAVSVTRPLTDKTPFPNRVAAANFGNAGKTVGLKLSKLALLAPEPEQESRSPDVAPLLRPSSTRKSLRGRLSQNFKTPFTKGNYWDVSPGDLEGLGGDLVEHTKQEMQAPAAEEDDEIEYMPPTALECPYEPPFEIPDYKVVGDSLFQLGHSCLVDDTADVFYALDIDQQIDVTTLLNDAGLSASGPSRLDSLHLPELEDDSPFARKPPAAKPTPASAPAKSAVSLARVSSVRAAPARTQAPPRPATTIPQSRSSSRTTTSPHGAAPAAAAAPAQTRTSALRAAKAAATSSSATNLVRLAPSASARSVSAPAAKKPSPTTSTSATTHTGTGTRVPVRSATTNGAARPPVAGSSSTSGVARPRSATVTSNTRPVMVTGRVAAPAKSRAPEDALVSLFEKQLGVVDEDFQFDV